MYITIIYDTQISMSSTSSILTPGSCHDLCCEDSSQCKLLTYASWSFLKKSWSFFKRYIIACCICSIVKAASCPSLPLPELPFDGATTELGTEVVVWLDRDFDCDISPPGPAVWNWDGVLRDDARLGGEILDDDSNACGVNSTVLLVAAPWNAQ